MNRKRFIEFHGATCRNWTWSWSFVNEREKFVIFGAWNSHTIGNTSRILRETWAFNQEGRKQAAYEQALEHIRLVEEEGYELRTFPMTYSDANKDAEGIGPAKIEGFIPELTAKFLTKIGDSWYASDGILENTLSEEVVNPEFYVEGASTVISVNRYERNADARTLCLQHHGYSCAVCAFDFERFYGAIGKQYIHVHHIVPLSEIRREYVLDPIKDLVPICPNCHAIIHRTQPPLAIAQLKEHLKSLRNSA